MSVVDYEVWKRRQLWTVAQAVCLLHGADPEKYDSLGIDSFAKSVPAIREVLIAVRDSIELNELTCVSTHSDRVTDWKVRPAQFLAWAKERGMIVPDALHDLATPALERPVETRERTTLLVMIGLLARELGIELGNHSKAANNIAQMAEQSGVKLAPRTIEEHLKKIPDALERRKQ